MSLPARSLPRRLWAAARRPAPVPGPTVWPAFSSAVCQQCRARQAASSARQYSSSSAVSSAVAAPLPSRRLLSVAGPDAAKFLQGAITANMQRLLPRQDTSSTVEDGLYAGFLSAQGRVLHDVFVYRDTLLDGGGAGEDAFLVEVDADDAATLAKHIKRYKLRAKFAVRVLDEDELAVWQRWGAGGEEEEATTSAPVHDTTRLVLRDTRAPGMGWRCLVRPGSASLMEEATTTLSSPEAYRVHRYLRGVAEGPRELLPGQALPLESNMDVMGGIDFHKGCYVGQELTIRTRHRGVVRKRILPCVVYGAEPGGPGALRYDPDGVAAAIPPLTSIARIGKRGRSAGKWLAGVGNLGLALCRLETMTDVVLPGEAAAVAVTAAATDPAVAEFVLNVAAADGDGDANAAGAAPPPPLKVRAFVPDWLRKGLAETAR